MVSLTEGVIFKSDLISTNTKLSEGFVDAMNLFSVDLFDGLKGDDNLFFSPYSVREALSVLGMAASNNTRTEIMDVLHNMNMDERNNDMYNLRMKISKDEDAFTSANSIWISDNYEVGEDATNEFLVPAKTFYDADIFKANFGDVNTVSDMNNWISHRTNNKINNMIEKTSIDDFMYIINAVYFNGKWEYPFNSSNSYPFNGTNGTSTIEMMPLSGEVFQYAETNDLMGISLPYEEGMAMDIWISKDDNPASLDSILNNMSHKDIANLINTLNSSDYERINSLLVPKFSYKQGTIDMIDYLKKLGMDAAFDPSKADFSVLDEGLFVSSFIHQATIDVDESGTEASAATVIGVSKLSAINHPGISFVVNKPFLFFIKNKETNAIIFMGMINNL